MQDKICLITGATSGIGKAAAFVLAKNNCHVILTGRSNVKGNKTAESIKIHTNNTKIKFIKADLSSAASIKELSEKLQSLVPRIDILINNAGVYYTKRHINEDGIEVTFMVNYLSRFYLTNLLIKLLEKGQDARILNISGEYHRKCKLDFTDLQLRKGYTGMKAVSRSKLADILFTYELSRKLEKSNIKVNCMHPGAVATGIILHDPEYPSGLKLLYKICMPFLRHPESAAEDIVYLLTDKQNDKISGKYFNRRKLCRSSELSYNTDISKKLWELSNSLLGTDY